jgi:hypothetical protein
MTALIMTAVLKNHVETVRVLTVDSRVELNTADK